MEWRYECSAYRSKQIQECSCDGDMAAMCNKDIQFEMVKVHEWLFGKDRVSQASVYEGDG